MQKKNSGKVKKLSKPLPTATKDEIRSFKEQPSIETTESNSHSAKTAADLFSLFTADIIRKRTVFTR